MISTATLAMFFSTGAVGGFPCPPFPKDAVMDAGHPYIEWPEYKDGYYIDAPGYLTGIRFYLRRDGTVAWGCAKWKP